jgi:hypothetical protein
MVNKKKKTTKKPKIYQKQKQAQKINIKIDNSKKTSKGARKPTTQSSPSVIYLGSNQAPQPYPVHDRFPYFFPHQEQKSLPEVATNISSTLLGQKLGEAPKSVFETLAQNTEPTPKQDTPRKTPTSEATTEKIDPKPKTIPDYLDVNNKRKPDTSESSSSSSMPKKTRASKAGTNTMLQTQTRESSLYRFVPPVAQPIPMEIGEEVGSRAMSQGKDSQHYWG